MKNITKVIFVAICVCILSACSDKQQSSPQVDLPMITKATESQEVVGNAAIRFKAADNPYNILVNKQNKLPEDWLSRITLIDVKNYLGEDFKIEEKTYEAFLKLQKDLLDNDSVNIQLDSVYRSVQDQQDLWDEWAADPEIGEEYCEKYLSPPGCSEHHTGICIDVFLVKDGADIRENEDMIADTESFAKVHAKLAQYGFILRFHQGKESVTGYNYEPWHFRFVNDPEIAKEIMEDNITFEEYLKK